MSDEDRAERTASGAAAPTTRRADRPVPYPRGSAAGVAGRDPPALRQAHLSLRPRGGSPGMGAHLHGRREEAHRAHSPGVGGGGAAAGSGGARLQGRGGGGVCRQRRVAAVVAAAAAAVRRSALLRFRRYVGQQLGLASYLAAPGDGRQRPQIPARDLLGALLLGQVLREASHHAIEALVRSPARRALGIQRRFGDDALSYFTERLSAAAMRQALMRVVRRAKRNKAFEGAHWIGLALDGTG